MMDSPRERTLHCNRRCKGTTVRHFSIRADGTVCKLWIRQNRVTMLHSRCVT